MSQIQRKGPELLVPASSLEVLKTAVRFGANAVYIGGEVFGLRAKAKNFSLEEMAQGVKFAHKYGVKVYLEPGEAVGWQCGVLVASVIDLIENEKQIAILDTSSEAHMPDTIIMPYTSEILGARILATRENEKISELKQGEKAYLLGGNTCLAGDIMGEYAFKEELQIGDKIVFLDQIHYSIVKNTTFNGVKLPNLMLLNQKGELELIKQFSYEDYARRN